MDAFERVGCVLVFKFGKFTGKCCWNCKVCACVVVVGYTVFVRFSAVKVFTRRRANEMSAEGTNDVTWCFVNMDRLMPSDVDFVSR